MGKHSKEKIKINFGKYLVLIFIVISLIAFIIGIKVMNKDEKEINFKTEQLKTIEGEKLVLKSNSEYNQIIEYYFENGIVSKVKIYEQFETKEKLQDKEQEYVLAEDISRIIVNEEDLKIEIEKQVLGSDTGLNYQEIYDKYMGILGAYEVIK